jgi:hypothetical protein
MGLRDLLQGWLYLLILLLYYCYWSVISYQACKTEKVSFIFFWLINLKFMIDLFCSSLT